MWLPQELDSGVLLQAHLAHSSLSPVLTRKAHLASRTNTVISFPSILMIITTIHEN